MEDECLTGDLVMLIDTHVMLHKLMIRHLPEPDKAGHETLLKNVIESLHKISERQEFNRATERLGALCVIIMDYINDHIRAGTVLRCSKNLE